MDAKILNTFISALVHVLKETEVEVYSIKKARLSSDQIHLGGLLVSVEIFGELEGKCCFTLSQETTCKLASILNFEEISQINSLVLSTMCEINNMVSGNALSKLRSMNYKCDITPPLVFYGSSDLVFEVPSTQFVTVDFSTKAGQISIHLFYKETV